LAAQRNLRNVVTRIADAEDLPFDDATFDLVTCRLALHHFADPRRALREFVRVLKTPGTLGFADNVTVEDPEAAAYYNAFERLRDPSHVNVVSMTQLCGMMEDAGLRIRWTHAFDKAFEFHEWTDRQHVSTDDKTRLLQMVRRIPTALEPWMQPRWTTGTLHFSLREAVIIAETA
jgi:SAM-dependent methyltransferase